MWFLLSWWWFGGFAFFVLFIQFLVFEDFYKRKDMKLSGEEDGDGPGEREREERVESKYIVRKKLKQCKIKLFIPKKNLPQVYANQKT